MGRSAPPWMILRVTPRQERFVITALDEFQIPAYAPMHITRPNLAKRIATRTRPLIPGYVFVRLDGDQDIDQARAIRGVREIMCRDGRPRHVPALAVAGLILAEAAHKFDETWSPPKQKGRRYAHRWIKGDRVKITGGAFDGFAGQVLRSMGRNRMEVLLTMFGRVQEVSVEHRQLVATQHVADRIAA